MSTFKKFLEEYAYLGKVFVVALAIVGLLFLPKMTFKKVMIWTTTEVLEEEEEKSNNFEEHLWNAKELVAKELNYDGPIGSLELYTSNGYYSYKLKTNNGYDSGHFNDAKAKTELDMAVSYRDNHAGVVDAVAASASGLESGVIFGIFAAVVVALLILFAAKCCCNWLDYPEEFFDLFKRQTTE